MAIATYEDTTGFAPADCRFFALDPDVYDGAAEGTIAGCYGEGATEADAVDDYWRRHADIMEKRNG